MDIETLREDYLSLLHTYNDCEKEYMRLIHQYNAVVEQNKALQNQLRLKDKIGEYIFDKVAKGKE